MTLTPSDRVKKQNGVDQVAQNLKVFGQSSVARVSAKWGRLYRENLCFFARRVRVDLRSQYINIQGKSELRFNFANTSAWLCTRFNQSLVI